MKVGLFAQLLAICDSVAILVLVSEFRARCDFAFVELLQFGCVEVQLGLLASGAGLVIDVVPLITPLVSIVYSATHKKPMINGGFCSCLEKFQLRCDFYTVLIAPAPRVLETAKTALTAL